MDPHIRYCRSSSAHQDRERNTNVLLYFKNSLKNPKDTRQQYHSYACLVGNSQSWTFLFIGALFFVIIATIFHKYTFSLDVESTVLWHAKDVTSQWFTFSNRLF